MLFETYLNDLVIRRDWFFSSFLTKKDNLLIISLRSLKRLVLIPDAPINYMLKGKSPTLTEFSNMLRSSDWIEAYIAVFEQLLNRKKRLFEETLKSMKSS